MLHIFVKGQYTVNSSWLKKAVVAIIFSLKYF